MLEQKTLDQLWNFDDPAGSEARFRAAAADERYDADERAELTTQLGRAIGLQGRYEEADALLDAVDADEPTVAVRVLLERGRVLNSSGHPEMAVPLFEQAAELADYLVEEFLAVDALHMLAIAWTLHDAGRCTEAMVEFQLAEQWADRIGTPRQQELAREAIKAC
jgi:tetratricopeptide (TPR) repeat protein